MRMQSIVINDNIRMCACGIVTFNSIALIVFKVMRSRWWFKHENMSNQSSSHTPALAETDISIITIC